MANEDNAAKAGVFAGVAGIALGAIALFRKGASQAGQMVVSFTSDIMELITALVAHAISIDLKLDDILAAIRSISVGGGGTVSGGYPDNSDTIIAQYVNCPQAQPATYSLPDIPIPKGMQIVLLGRNPAGPNGGIVWVSGTQQNSSQNLQSYPVLPGVPVSYKVENANALWIGATVAGEGAYITVEVNNG